MKTILFTLSITACVVCLFWFFWRVSAQSIDVINALQDSCDTYDEGLVFLEISSTQYAECYNGALLQPVGSSVVQTVTETVSAAVADGYYERVVTNAAGTASVTWDDVAEDAQDTVDEEEVIEHPVADDLLSGNALLLFVLALLVIMWLYFLFSKKKSKA